MGLAVLAAPLRRERSYEPVQHLAHSPRNTRDDDATAVKARQKSTQEGRQALAAPQNHTIPISPLPFRTPPSAHVRPAPAGAERYIGRTFELRSPSSAPAPMKSSVPSTRTLRSSFCVSACTDRGDRRAASFRFVSFLGLPCVDTFASSRILTHRARSPGTRAAHPQAAITFHNGFPAP